ncbi:MAG: group 1 glycosyl transferase [Pseudonocardiales bacterium]|nr:group 1 glycosyl transferase [Pseudonocardiales bacterium]
MSVVVMATRPAAAVMGQQQYQEQVASRMTALLPGFRRVIVRSLRSTLPGDVRLPLTAVGRLPLFIQGLVSRSAFGPFDLLHRDELIIPASRREVVTVHDLAPLRFDDEGQGNVPAHGPASVRHAAAVICPSAFAASEVTALFGPRAVEVIHNGIDDAIFQLGPASADVHRRVRMEHGLPERFVLHSGGATIRKNLAALADAWRTVHQQAPEVVLVLCGTPHPSRNELFTALPGVRLMGHINRAVQLDLMRTATVAVVPSIYEGFGLPAIEAMAAGTAVVAARRASLPEICGPAAVLCEPDAGALAAAILAVLENGGLRRRLEVAGLAHSAQFTWDRSARRHAEVFLSAIDSLNRN